jgi:hypothetical protein
VAKVIDSVPWCPVLKQAAVTADMIRLRIAAVQADPSNSISLIANP